MHDPIRGDVPHHRMYMPDVGADEDLLGVPNLRGDRNSAVGRVVVSRPRSVVTPTERTMVGDWRPPSGPGSGRGSRLMSPTSDVPPVSGFLLSEWIGLCDVNAKRMSCRERGQSRRSCSRLLMPLRSRETSLEIEVCFMTRSFVVVLPHGY